MVGRERSSRFMCLAFLSLLIVHSIWISVIFIGVTTILCSHVFRLKKKHLIKFDQSLIRFEIVVGL